MNIHQQHFEKNSFIWYMYEKDGSTPERIDKIINPIQGPVGVVGGGWGLISKHLINKGIKVFTIDTSATMASYAKQKRGIETIAIDFLDYRFPESISTLIINTGVLTPSVVHNFRLFAKQTSINLPQDGTALICFHQRDLFDEIIEHLGLTTSNSLIEYLCDSIKVGESLISALQKSKVGSRLSEYIKLRFAEKFYEYELQIKSLVDINNDSKFKNKIELIESLRYVSFGLTYEEQVFLTNAFGKAGFRFDTVYEESSIVFIKLTKI